MTSPDASEISFGDVVGTNRFGEYLDEFKRVVGSVLEDYKSPAVDLADSFAPNRTGYLVSKMEAEVIETDDGYVLELRNTAWYAVYKELGTRTQTATPFLRPTLDVLAPSIASSIQDAISDLNQKYAGSR